jgi:hypothetical protein
MPIKLRWTAPADAQIRHLRHAGATWDAIAASLGVSRNAVRERGRHIGARLPPPPPRPDPECDPHDLGREALPPGHPLTWGAITQGTWQAGRAYPWPPLPPSE